MHECRMLWHRIGEVGTIPPVVLVTDLKGICCDGTVGTHNVEGESTTVLAVGVYPICIAVLSHDAAMAGNAQSLGAPLQNEAVALFVPASPADLQCDLDLDASLVSVQYGPASSSLSGDSEPHISFPVHTSPADFG